MKAYILSIAGIVLITAVVTVIAPSGKMGKFIKGALKLTVLAVLVSPFVGFFTKGEMEFPVGKTDFVTDSAYMQACAEQMTEQDKQEISAFLEQEYGVQVELDVERSVESGFPLKKIQVKVVDSGINESDEHIDMVMKMKAALEERYGCPAEVS